MYIWCVLQHANDFVIVMDTIPYEFSCSWGRELDSIFVVKSVIFQNANNTSHFTVLDAVHVISFRSWCFPIIPFDIKKSFDALKRLLLVLRSFPSVSQIATKKQKKKTTETVELMGHKSAV